MLLASAGKMNENYFESEKVDRFFPSNCVFLERLVQTSFKVACDILKPTFIALLKFF